MNKCLNLTPFNALKRFTSEFSLQKYLHVIYIITNQNTPTHQSEGDFFFSFCFLTKYRTDSLYQFRVKIMAAGREN